MSLEVQCPRCFGRGYCLRYPDQRTIRTYPCPRCRAMGYTTATPARETRRVAAPEEEAAYTDSQEEER